MTILVVEDDERQRAALDRMLARQGYRVLGAGSAADAKALATSNDVGVVILDLGLPDSSDFETLRDVRRLAPDTQCIVLTGHHVNPDDARAAGASDYFEKPITDPTRFSQVVRRCVEVHLLQRRIARSPTAPVDPIVGDSPAIDSMRLAISRFASSAAPVLITGESGSGKELVAEAIHKASRRKGEFVRVNCAALPAALIEAELFGTEAGTFTGQSGARKGLIATADKGTLFLDEIGEMPIELQPKLLRALQSHQYMPVGGRKDLEMSARVVAATNVDLDRAVKQGKFREDLVFRLRVLEVAVPPLRERQSDIPLLVHHFTRVLSAAEGRPPPKVPPDVMQSLMTRPWPGNIRELSNAMQRAIVMCPTDTLTVADFGLSAPVQRTRSSGPVAAWEALFAMPMAEARTQAADLFMREYIKRLLAAHDGNITHAARTAGVHRPNLRREIRRLGMDDDEPSET